MANFKLLHTVGISPGTTVQIVEGIHEDWASPDVQRSAGVSMSEAAFDAVYEALAYAVPGGVDKYDITHLSSRDVEVIIQRLRSVPSFTIEPSVKRFKDDLANYLEDARKRGVALTVLGFWP